MDSFFSIVIPVYKAEQYIDECIQSILKQNYTDYQVILVDDGSPDNSPMICDEYARKYNNIISIHQKNSGPSVARNTGLRVADGEYILFLDSDDYWDSPDCLQIIYDRIAITHPDILLMGVYKYYSVSQKKELYRMPLVMDDHWSDEEKISQCMKSNSYVACPWDRALKKSFLMDHDLSFVEGMLSEDIEWSVRVLLFNPSVDTISIPLYVYRQQNSSSITSNITRRNLKDIISIFDKYLSDTKYRDNTALMHFLAEQYILWMATSGVVTWREKKGLIRYMSRYWYLVDYDLYPHVRTAHKIKFIGYYLMVLLIGTYNRLRKG